MTQHIVHFDAIELRAFLKSVAIHINVGAALLDTFTKKESDITRGLIMDCVADMRKFSDDVTISQERVNKAIAESTERKRRELLGDITLASFLKGLESAGDN